MVNILEFKIQNTKGKIELGTKMVGYPKQTKINMQQVSSNDNPVQKILQYTDCKLSEMYSPDGKAS